MFDGPKGESIFSKPFLFTHGVNEAVNVLGKVKESKDDRSIAISAALAIEFIIDNVLALLIPKYYLLTERTDFSFSFKITLLKALKIIPLHILQCCDAIRNIRNDFAHDLNKQSFESIKKNHLEFIKQLYLHIDYTPDKNKTNKEIFDQVTWVAICGLDSYKSNIMKLAQKINEEVFISDLEKDSIKDMDDFINKDRTDKLVKIDIVDGVEYRYYEDGFVDIKA
jgi:hypothetical protein